MRAASPARAMTFSPCSQNERCRGGAQSVARARRQTLCSYLEMQRSRPRDACARRNPASLPFRFSE